MTGAVGVAEAQIAIEAVDVPAEAEAAEEATKARGGACCE